MTPSSNTAAAFNPHHVDEALIVSALASGAHAPVLQAYFGAEPYAELQLLAQRALNAPLTSSAKVYVLPGLLGSRLGISRKRGDELLWLDPAALVSGRLLELAMGKRRSLRALGVMLPGYLKLRLTLQAAGFNTVFHPYDWRRSARDLGERLAADMAADPAREIMIVAHSMGGLIARVAMKRLAGAKLTRVIQLGTPNEGSFALVQALRACYPTVLKLGAVDQVNDAALLAQRVFRSFTSLYEMLPHAQHLAGVNLFDHRVWPADALTPDAERLKLARRLPRHLAVADRRCHSIIGVDCRTVTGIDLRGNELVYRYTTEGDGTVPMSLASWSGAKHWYVHEAHGQLPRNTAVCRAVVELLQNETTTQLLERNDTTHPSITERSERELRQQLNGKVRWDALPLNERRDLLEPTISPLFASLCDRR